jgi:hypothetical protein
MARYPTREGCKLQDWVEDITSYVVGTYGSTAFIFKHSRHSRGDCENWEFINGRWFKDNMEGESKATIICFSNFLIELLLYI